MRARPKSFKKPTLLHGDKMLLKIEGQLTKSDQSELNLWCKKKEFIKNSRKQLLRRKFTLAKSNIPSRKHILGGYTVLRNSL